MKDIFEFNHIDKSLSESDVATLKDFYSHYHKKYWCFKRSYRSYKFLDDVFTISRICLVAIGTISGGITLNPVVLGVVNGAGVVVAGIGKKLERKRITKEKLRCQELHLRLMKKYSLNYEQLFEEISGTNKSLLIA